MVLAGCGGSTQDAAAAAAADAFVDAVAARNGGAACALLTDRARESVESFGRVCAQVVTQLPADPGPVEKVEVWGDAAQVRFAGEVLFLSRFDDGWRIHAAGCTPRPGDAPYRCELEG